MAKFQYKDEDLLAYLSDKIVKCGGELTTAEFEDSVDKPCSLTTIQRRLGSWSRAKKLALGPGKKEEDPNRKKFPNALTTAEFQEKFDIKKKIENALHGLDGVVIPDADLKAELNIPQKFWRDIPSDWARQYRITVRGKKYWGMTKTLDEVESMMDIPVERG